jgi:hypothetical protein
MTVLSSSVIPSFQQMSLTFPFIRSVCCCLFRGSVIIHFLYILEPYRFYSSILLFKENICKSLVVTSAIKRSRMWFI